MQAIYRTSADVVLHKAVGADIAAGDVVVIGSAKNLIGVAQQPIPENTTGALAISGIFEIAKTAAEEYADGAVLYWDASAGKVTSGAGGGKPVIGICKGGAGNDNTTALVVLKSADSTIVTAEAPMLLDVATVAAAGENQGAAKELTAGKHVYLATATANNLGIKIKAAQNVKGSVIYIVNTDGSLTVTVYPTSGGKINGGQANAGIDILPSSSVGLICTADTGKEWWAISVVETA